MTMISILNTNIVVSHQVKKGKDVIENHKTATDDEIEQLQSEVNTLLWSKIKVRAGTQCAICRNTIY